MQNARSIVPAITLFTQCAESLGVQSGVESEDAAGVLMGGLLLFDVLAQDVNGRTAAA